MRKYASSSKAITQTKDLQPPTKKQQKTYEATDHGLIRWDYRNGEWTPLQIANFTARVIEDLRVDDGVEVAHEYRVEAVLNGGKTVEVVDLPSGKFDRMNWMGKSLGIGAIVNAGCERHVRAAIKYLSIGQFTTRNVYRHTGWRKIGERMLYLHVAGGIAKTGPIRSVETKLTRELRNFTLPDPPRTLPRLAEVIAAALRFLDVAPDRITVPLFAAMCRSVLGEVNFSVHITAQNQSGKSQLAALIQQFFGSAMDFKNFPTTWESTENFLERLAFEAKDAILVIDDFKPDGSPQQKQEMHAKADRVLRAQGNRSGRGRLNADLESVSSKPPRGLILSTGEETPNGQSLQARMVVLDLSPFDIDKKVLTQCQEDAAAGLYAEANAAFIRWLAGNLDRIPRLLFDELNRYRRTFQSSTKGLSRSPDNVFQLAIAFGVFLSFAVEMKALTVEQAQPTWKRVVNGLRQAIQSQQTHQTISDPCTRFFELIGTLINAGEGHIADGKKGGPPSKADARWGWREREDGKPGKQPQGVCLGWLHPEGLFLPEGVILPAVLGLAARCHEHFEISFTQLKRQLLQRKLLLSSDIETARRSFTVRKTCQGKEQHTLLHVSPQSIFSTLGGKSADRSDGSTSQGTAAESGWEKLSDFHPFSSGEQRANRRKQLPSKSSSKGQSVGFVGSLGGGGRMKMKTAPKEPLRASSEPSDMPTKNGNDPTKNGYSHYDEWQRAGFESAEGFGAWYETVYANHPTRGGLQAARTALEKAIAEGAVTRESFEAGYAAFRQSSAWLRENGRFIPKLSTFVEDRGWAFPPVEQTKETETDLERRKREAIAEGLKGLE